MTFLSPERLWLLLGVLALAAVYVVVQRRRKTYALRFASSDLFRGLATDSPGVRRHVPAALFLVATTVLVGAFAQPATQVRVPRERATVIVAIDVSLSMMAEDVDPNRLEAAQAAAHRFVDELPPTLNVGLVSFAGSAAVQVPPTLDRTPVHTAIDNLELAESTAIGEAIFTSLKALDTLPTSEADNDPPPARIVLLSDGETTVGRPDAEAVQAAIAEDVQISTIAFGTANGYIVYDNPETPFNDPTDIPVPVREDSLKQIADDTAGSFFTASSLEELEAVYADIGSAIGYEEIDKEITDRAVGVGLAIMMLAAGLSLAWFQRLP